MTSSSPRAQKHSIGFGIEGLGIVALRVPALVALLVVLGTLITGVGLAKLKTSDSLSALFRSDSHEFQVYDSTSKKFPTAEFDVLLAVESDQLLSRGNLEALRDLVTDLQLVDGVSGAISLFSIRQPPEGDAVPRPLIPADLPEGPAYQRIVDELMNHSLIRGKLLSEDGKLALIVLALDPARASTDRNALISDIKNLTDNLPAGLHVSLTGVPVMQQEIADAARRDLTLYGVLGFVFAAVVASAFFRSFRFVVIAATPPLLAIVWSLGVLGWLGVETNVFLNVLTPVIMVVSFADTTQLLFYARDRLLQGDDNRAAFVAALRVVGPACVLTHVTAAVSFGALVLSNSALLKSLGIGGVLAMCLSLFIVLCVVPLLGIATARLGSAAPPSPNALVNGLIALCRWAAARMVRHPGRYSGIGFLIVAALSLSYWHLEPRFRLAEQLPANREALSGADRIDAKLTGSYPIDIVVTLPPKEGIYSERTLAAVTTAHEAAEKSLANVWSMETLRRWLAQSGEDVKPETIRRYIELLPESLVRRFVADDNLLITGRVQDADASRLTQILDALEASLVQVRADYPDFAFDVTGLAALSARTSATMISRLNQSLTAEIALVALILALAFRSFSAGISSVLPALFPVLLAGTLLHIGDRGLQFSSVIALMISFGISLSATIHFLNRLNLAQAETGNIDEAIEAATVGAGPSVMLTALVLAAGLSVTLLSDLPSLHVFGLVSAVAIIAAVFADLFILRPVVASLHGLRH